MKYLRIIIFIAIILFAKSIVWGQEIKVFHFEDLLTYRVINGNDSILRFKTANVGVANSTETADFYIIQDERVNSLIERYVKFNETKSGFDGWRVQIYFGSGTKARVTAQQIQEKFMTDYPEYEAYIVYHEPYFKVRVGDFRTKQEAGKFKKTIETEYTSSWIVEDIIKFPALYKTLNSN